MRSVESGFRISPVSVQNMGSSGMRHEICGAEPALAFSRSRYSDNRKCPTRVDGLLQTASVRRALFREA